MDAGFNSSQDSRMAEPKPKAKRRTTRKISTYFSPPRPSCAMTQHNHDPKSKKKDRPHSDPKVVTDSVSQPSIPSTKLMNAKNAPTKEIYGKRHRFGKGGDYTLFQKDVGCPAVRYERLLKGKVNDKNVKETGRTNSVKIVEAEKIQNKMELRHSGPDGLPMLLPSITRLIEMLQKPSHLITPLPGPDILLGSSGLNGHTFNADPALKIVKNIVETELQSEASLKQLLTDSVSISTRSEPSAVKTRAQARRSEAERRQLWFAQILQEHEEEHKNFGQGSGLSSEQQQTSSGFSYLHDLISKSAADGRVLKGTLRISEDQGHAVENSEITSTLIPLSYKKVIDPVQALNSPSKISLLQSSSATSSPRRKTTASASPFFDSLSIQKASSLSFPALSSTHFGLVQERLSTRPFQLLVAVIFLNKTKGSVSMPICSKMLELYPSPEDLAAADPNDIISLIRPLGLQNRRAKLIIDLARVWIVAPPLKAIRYRELRHTARRNEGDVINYEPVVEEEIKTPWEVSHLPGVGTYAIDSWRIFCRDSLQGVATGLRPFGDQEGIEQELQQEWCEVLPQDKELRAYLKWRWLRLGFLWDSLDGSKIAVSREIVEELARGELRSYHGYRNPWFMDSVLQERFDEPSIRTSGIDEGRRIRNADCERLDD